MFNKALISFVALAAAQTAVAAPQLGILPSLVCITEGSALSGLTGLLGGLTILSCSAGETCEPLAVELLDEIPIVGSLLAGLAGITDIVPIGICS